MDDSQQERYMGFSHETIPECHHLCLIYDSEEQLQKIVSGYMATGLKQGDVVRYAADQTSPEQVRAWVLETGTELPENAPFKIVNAESFYCPGGRFNPQELIDAMAPRYDQVQKAGYRGSRACGEMSWALRDIPGSERFLEYEALINTVTSTVPYIGMCLYDTRLFSGDVLFKVLQVHPYMVAQGQIVRNPFFLRPEEFLKKYRPGLS